MNDQTISIERIQATKSFKSLNSVQKEFVLKRENRKLLTNGLIVHKNIGVIPANVTGYNLNVLNDLILDEFDKNNEKI